MRRRVWGFGEAINSPGEAVVVFFDRHRVRGVEGGLLKGALAVGFFLLVGVGEPAPKTAAS